MEDFISKNIGASVFIKTVANAMTIYDTHEKLMQALVDGTFTIDRNGINPAGVEQMGTRLGKATLLSDETAASLGLDETAVPDDVLKIIIPLSTAEVIDSNRVWTAPFNCKVLVICIGGGGGGGGGYYNSRLNNYNGGGGGGSGHISIGTYTIAKGTAVNVTIGSSGSFGSYETSSWDAINKQSGGNGGTTSFGTYLSAAGGGGGYLGGGSSGPKGGEGAINGEKGGASSSVEYTVLGGQGAANPPFGEGGYGYGNAAKGYGAGGGGGRNWTGSNPESGGYGSHGVVLLFYIPTPGGT